MNLRLSLIPILLAGTQAAWPLQGSVDVSAFGAHGDGQTDDTAAVQRAINSVGAGATLTFGGPNQVYLISSSLIFQPYITYQGQGTIRMNASATPHTAIGILQYNAANSVTFSGMTFDANGVGGGLQVAVGGLTAIPATGVTVNQVVFRNTTATPAGPWDGALFDPVGLVNSQLTNNQVVNCAYGMTLVDPNNVTISNNFFQAVHYGDAISVTFQPAPFAYGQGIQITQNSGQHLGRMGIELWPSGGNVAQTSQVQGIVISGNTFSQWDTGYSSDTFGISIMAGQQYNVASNKLVGPNGGFGIEVGAPQSTISQNAITGFTTGIIMHDSSNSTISGNLLTTQNYDGIEFSNAAGNRQNVIVQNNSIMDAQTFGIFINTPDWGGTLLTGNFISRTDGVYETDPTQSYTGITTTPPMTPVTVSGNSITQAGTNGPAGFSFMGIRVNGGQGANASSVYQNNAVLSQLMLSQSFGLFGNSYGTLDGTVVQGNTFTGLYSASGGGPSTAVISTGNMVYNCSLSGPIVLTP